MGPGGCCTARSVLAYKLRAADDAIIDPYSEMSDIYAGDLNPRYACMDAVCCCNHLVACATSLIFMHEHATHVQMHTTANVNVQTLHHVCSVWASQPPCCSR